MKESDPRALVNQQIPRSFVELEAGIRKMVALRGNNQPPIMEEKEFCDVFSNYFDDVLEMKEAVRFLSLQGKHDIIIPNTAALMHPIPPGTLLHFDDHQLKMYYFLDPMWVAKLMAKVVQPHSPAKDGEFS